MEKRILLFLFTWIFFPFIIVVFGFTNLLGIESDKEGNKDVVKVLQSLHELLQSECLDAQKESLREVAL